jgi:hypothetical protein
MFYSLQPKRRYKKLSVLLLIVLGSFRFASAQNTDCKGEWLSTLESKMLASYPTEYKVDKTKTKCFTLPSNTEIPYNFRFDTDYEYDIILLSDPSSKASGIEIRDKQNRKIQFSKVYRKEPSNVVVVTFEPSYNEEYKILVKSIYGKLESSCAELLVVMQEKKLSGEEDEEDDQEMKMKRQLIKAQSAGNPNN